MPSIMPFTMPSVDPWRGYAPTTVSPTSYPWLFPQGIPQGVQFSQGLSGISPFGQIMPGFSVPGLFMPGSSISGQVQPSPPSRFPVANSQIGVLSGHNGMVSHGIAQANLVGCTSGYYPASSLNVTSSNGGGPLMQSDYSSMGSTSGLTQTNTLWYFESGATSHVTNNLNHITHPQPSLVNGGVQVGNGTQLSVPHTGSGLLPTPNAKFRLSHILPAITHNLLSVQQFSHDNNCILIFYSHGRHSGQDFPRNFVQGAMQQGSLSTSELI